MHGRGVYKFSAASPAAFFIGELKENQFHGLGRMEFRDGTQYLGSFNFNAMASQQAIVKHANGDRYKGGVAQNMKSDENGSYVFGATGDRYEGAFRGDRREGKGRMLMSGQPEVVYEGEYKDDKKTGAFTLLDLGPKHGKLVNGRFGPSEELDGHCEKF